MATALKPLAPTITSHCWNHDGTMLALCPNTPEVWVYTNCQDPDISKWEKKYVLAEHDLIVSGIDWHPATNKIVTCSHDRNAFVWSLNPETDTWKATIAILRINRAATCVKWSPDGRRFAVASGAKVVPICTYEAENDWWVSLQVHKHRSTVLSVAWHPNSQIIATACADFQCRVLSVTDSKLDKAPDSGPFAAVNPFGEVYMALDDAKGWVEDVAWSPSGTRLAFVAHDATIHMVQFYPTAEPVLQTIKSRDLPYTRCVFLGEDTVVAAGHNLNPTAYTINAEGMWSVAAALDKKTTKAAATSAFAQRRSMFDKKASDSSSSSGAGSTAVASWTKHKGAIMDLRLLTAGTRSGAGAGATTLGGAPGAVVGFSTSGNDGRVVKWEFSSMSADMAALKLG